MASKFKAIELFLAVSFATATGTQILPASSMDGDIERLDESDSLVSELLFCWWRRW